MYKLAEGCRFITQQALSKDKIFQEVNLHNPVHTSMKLA